MYRRNRLSQDILRFFAEFAAYLKHRVVQGSFHFERAKNFIVKRLLWRRGTLSRPITHVSLVAFSLVVVFVAVMFGKMSVFATSSEAARQNLVTKLQSPVDAPEGSVLEAAITTDTQVSEKPRDQIIEHTVAGGETLSTIAQQYGIDSNTIRWANSLADKDTIKPGDKLKILPVSGVAYNVQSGDTIYSIAEKFRANPQAIADFPFNPVGEDLRVQAGQTLIVPDGVPPLKPAPKTPQPRYVAQSQPKKAGSVNEGSDDRNEKQKTPSSAGFIWPVGGIITQYRTSYHAGDDIAGPMGTPVVASAGGVVIAAQKLAVGYGWHVIIDHQNGYQTMYAHLSRIDVSVGQKVGQGKTVGLRGSTGRSTGSHLHFEIRKGSSFLNPLNFLK